MLVSEQYSYELGWCHWGTCGGCKVNGGVGLGWGERYKPWRFSFVDEEGLGQTDAIKSPIVLLISVEVAS